MQLLDWKSDSAVYLIATSHKRMRAAHDLNCDGGNEFGCHGVDESHPAETYQVCIVRDPLTCNLLPNCAQYVTAEEV